MSTEYTIDTDILVIGSGFAGMFDDQSRDRFGCHSDGWAYAGKAGSTHFSEISLLQMEGTRWKSGKPVSQRANTLIIENGMKSVSVKVKV
jgi:hypothetical protein